MSAPSRWRSRREEAWCLVRVSHRFEDLSAHVELLDQDEVGPGDVVLVHGARIDVPFGEERVERRRATVVRAGWLERAWTRLTGDLDCLSLLEIELHEGNTP